jgi:hypothetical protein
MRHVDLDGIECLELTNGRLTLLAAVSVGPRILSLRLRDGPNLFAILPKATLDCPGIGVFHFYGGHRLWVAPEVPASTYLPDDYEVNVETMDGGVRLVQAPHPGTSIQKTIELRLVPSAPRVEVRHVLRNVGRDSRRLAPWAITQLVPGGVAILPQTAPRDDESGVLPNRQIAIWPYTDLSSDCLHWGNRAILIEARMREGMLKLGYPNPSGWMGYWREGTLFVKSARLQAGAEYLDLGSSSECYCDPRFLELETLGPVTELRSGESVVHSEIWAVHASVQWTEDLAEVYAAAAEG